MEKRSHNRKTILFFADIVCINLAYIFSFYIRFDLNIPREILIKYIESLPLIIIFYIIPLVIYKMYSSLWSNASIDEFIKGLIACITGGLINIAYNLLFNIGIPTSLVVASSLIIFVFIVGVRLSYRIYRRVFIYGKIKNDDKREKVLVIGGGSCGNIVIEEMFTNEDLNMVPVGIIDDDKNKIGTLLKGVKIVGNRNDIEFIVKERNVNMILLAISRISSKDKKDILELCNRTNIKIKIIPGIYEIMDGKVNLTKMRDVDLKDLLGREEVVLDKKEVENYINGKVVLVTGGGGSIGSELCRQIACYSPKLLLILDIYENNAYDLQNELSRSFKNLNHKVIIASVREKYRIEKIFKEYKPEVIFHAAAHKHVPLMEENSEEAIKNNIVGTLNVAETASKFKAEKFVLISTDKAVNPTNVMGATKRVCEMIIQAMNNASNTEFVAVRFGNVLGSNGSVIPLFKNQIKSGGPVTLTHKEITRYFMLIPEAAQLVLQAGAYAEGGEIFVLDMGEPVKIYDLAKKLIKLSGYTPNKEIKIEITGLRPGEKLYEELLMEEEGLKETANDKIFIGRPGEFNIKTVKRNIAELLMVVLNGSSEELKSKLKEVVPTYIEEKDDEEVAATLEN
ncbi:MAG: polysaccharide biosynthesis protein [Clostridium sp.]|uniref:polysaccharide biosynthesis protein n=1 Tax=Clostridium sp. TaxID=1506 RepID=UPI003F3B10C4